MTWAGAAMAVGLAAGLLALRLEPWVEGSMAVLVGLAVVGLGVGTRSRSSVMGRRLSLALMSLAAAAAATPAHAHEPEAAAFRDVIIRFNAEDGTPLEGKLSIPSNVQGPVPVLFYLHGAGPGTYDTPRAFRDTNGQIVRFNYYDFFAREMAARGVAFFRVSKRGCTIDPVSGREVVDREVFSKATRGVLVGDYARALDVLRARPEVDAGRIVIGGASEGTALAARLAVHSPEGVVAVVLHSFAGDNLRDTLVWQNTVGPWRNIQHVFVAARDGALTRAEYDSAVLEAPRLATALPFAALDANTDGQIDATDLSQLNKPRLDAFMQAIEQRNDDLLWDALLNLTSAHFLEDWETPPIHEVLRRIEVPIGIFHGELDGTTRVEAVRETEDVFRAAGKSNLTVRIYPGVNHDLGWNLEAMQGASPPAFRDSFDFVASATGLLGNDHVRPKGGR